MIPFVRRPLPAGLSATLTARTAELRGSANPYEDARKAWKAAGPIRRGLKRHLCTACARPAFCMYCHESRGTDVDHYEPIKRRPLRAFDWHNHLLACSCCNQQAKQEIFPVDPAGRPLLLDPAADDSADHMTLASTGEFIDLTPRGAETIAVLGLNRRGELVQARYRSWRGVIRVFEQAARNGDLLSPDDLEDLRFLPVVEAFHHFAHDIAAGRLPRKGVRPGIVSYAQQNLAVVSGVFAACRLKRLG
ncbi:HNH endonuclease family protein [Actinoplanes siamensis]|uniref:HNH endonuclease n=1 Tax=Actinoplanes siamensis TaxID=1223317 RepID=A0A919N948_9ACTN|nr:hypothetical protein [Actinoplanes siamensis]GIF06731.1 hypothetical protein Asi03nite_42690 [Actinoplanes siamensis]